MMSLFSKKKNKVVVNYIDLDNDGEKIATSGELIGDVGTTIEYNTKKQVSALTAQGYKLDSNDFDPKGKTPTFPEDDDHVYVISFKHNLITVDHEDASLGINKSDLEKVGTQTIHYDGAATRTPKDSVSHVTFKCSVTYDQVTKKIIDRSDWTPDAQSFIMVATPEVPGYITSQSVVGGDTVTPDDCDRDYTVSYEINHKLSTADQKVTVKYVDLDLGNQIITADTLTGKPNMPVDYDPKATIESLTSQGYALVKNDYNPAGEVQFFGSNDDYVPVFVVTMKHTIGVVDREHPDDKIAQEEYTKEVNFTVNYAGAEDATPAANVQTAHWNRSLTVDKVSGEIIEDDDQTTNWQVDQDSFADVATPVVNGYHADQKVVKGGKVTKEDVTKTVNYAANGHVVPVDHDGNQIESAPQPVFETDPQDPTRVLDEQAVPKLDDYKCDVKTVVPLDPSKDATVTYKPAKDDDVLVIPVGQKKTESKAAPSAEKSASFENKESEAKPNPATAAAAKAQETADKEKEEYSAKLKQIRKQHEEDKSDKEQIAIINYIDLDQNGKQLTSSGPLTGKPGDSINDLYSTDIPLKAITKAGYEVVFNSFDDTDAVQRFDNNDLMTQVFTIGLRKAKKQTSLAERQAANGLDLIRNLDFHNKDEVAAMALGVATTLINLIGLAGDKNKDR